MSLYDAALRADIAEAKAQIAAGVKPRNVFEAVLHNEARDQVRQERARRA